VELSERMSVSSDNGCDIPEITLVVVFKIIVGGKTMLAILVRVFEVKLTL
jgi:hypothetical protein